jgi:hypothetical protein
MGGKRNCEQEKKMHFQSLRENNITGKKTKQTQIVLLPTLTVSKGCPITTVATPAARPAT